MNKKLHIEIVKAKKSFPNPDAKDLVWRYISSNIRGFKLDDVVRGQDVLEFSGHIHSYTVCSSSSMVQWPVNVEDVIFHVYTMQQSEQNVLNVRERWNKWDPIENYVYFKCHPSLSFQITDTDAESVTTSNHWMLPNAEFHGLWESLIYDEGIKENVLDLLFLELSLLALTMLHLPLAVAQVRGDDHALFQAGDRLQFDQLQSPGAAPRTAGHWKDQSVPGNRPEALYPIPGQVRRLS